MEYNNSKRTITMPLIIGASLIAGILIGYKFIPENHTSQKHTKLSSVIGIVQANYVEKVSTDSLQEIAVVEFLKNLDPHSRYIRAKDMEASTAPLEGQFDGIGILFNIQNDTILILSTISGGPSQKIGLLPGDRIVFVNDTIFAGIGLTNDIVMQALKGKRGTKVKVGIHRRGFSELFNYTITRDKIPIYSIDVSYMLTPKTGYIKISRFAGTTHEEFKKHSKKLLDAGMENLVLDLRQNGGGYLRAAVGIADEFLSEGKMIVYMQGQARPKSEFVATEKGSCENIKLALLIDPWSASASEIVAGAIQDNDRGTIVGKRSFGKGLVQEPVMFPDGSGVRLTTSRYYTPTGRCIQKSYSNKINYEEDIYLRAAHGEFESADSTLFVDSLKYKTPEGRTVYGGGGIMPDVFVPTDTIGVSDFFTQARNKGYFYKYALDYADNHRQVLSKYKEHNALSAYLKKQNILTDFILFTKAERAPKLNSQQENLVTTFIFALIARNMISDAGYFPIINKTDADIKKAISVLNSDK